MENMKTSIINWLDVVSRVPQFFDLDIGKILNTNKSDVISYLEEEEIFIKARLKPVYGSDLSSDSYSKTKILNTNKDQDFIFTDSKLIFINKSTQVYKFEFTSSTGFTVKSDYDGNFSGTTSSDLVMTDIKVLSSSWSGFTFNKGDIIYLSTYYYDKVLVGLVTNASAAKMMEQTYISDSPNISVDAELLRKSVNSFMKRLTSDDEGNLLSISKLYIDTTPEAINYDIDTLGNDITEYSN